MTTLNDIPIIKDNIKSAPLKTIKAFHKIIFEIDGDRTSRRKVREFSGFPFDNNSDEYKQKLAYIETNFSVSDLSVISNIINIDYNVDKKDLIKTICEKLMDLQELKRNIEQDEGEDQDEEEEDEKEEEFNNEVASQNSFMSESRYQMPTFSMNFRDMEDSIRSFDRTSAIPIEKWISDLEDLAMIMGWTELHKFVFARKSLKGLAKLFIQSESNINTYDSLKKALLKEFSATLTSAQVHQMLAKRKISRNGSVEEYFLKMRELANRSKIEDASLMQYVIDGITDDVRNKVVLFGATTMTEFKQKLKIYNEIKSKVESRSQTANETNSSYSGTKPKTKEFNKREEKSIRCNNCGGQGHFSKDCRNRDKGVKCFACQKFGHKANECKEKSAKEEIKKPVCFTETEEPNGTYLQINIGKHTINALVDTGSSVNLIKASEYLRSNPKQLESETIKLSGIGANEIATVGSFKTTIEVNGLVGEIEMHVVPDTAMPPPMVIGRDFLKDYDVNISDGEITALHRTETSFKHNDTITEISMQADILIENEIYVMNSENRKEVENLIEEYTPSSNPKNTGITMKLLLTNENPIYQRARRLATVEQKEVEGIINEWERNGIIRPSSSDFAGAIVPVKKKNGSIRVCVDYRQLNRKTVKDRYPLPIIDDQLDKFRDAKVFTTLDLRNGFHHVKVDEESIKYTAFVTPKGQYEFQRMPFGLCNALAVFQRYVNKVFDDLINKGIVLTYMDDLILPATENEEALAYFKIVLRRAAEHGLEFNWGKCQFMTNEIEYLGYRIHNNTIKPSVTKIKAIIKFPKPTSTKVVQFSWTHGSISKIHP